MESSVDNVYLIGDGAGGAATIVEAIRDAQKAAKAIIGEKVVSDPRCDRNRGRMLRKEGRPQRRKRRGMRGRRDV